MEFFLRPEVLKWTAALMKTGGIYKYRWGDAGLRYVTLAVFASEHEVLHRMKLDIKYCHPCEP